MYFAELEPSESRIFTVLIDNQIQKGPIKFERNYSATELDFELKEETSSFTLVKAFNSTRGPLINAFEMYQIVSTSPATSSTDGQDYNLNLTFFHLQIYFKYINPNKALNG